MVCRHKDERRRATLLLRSVILKINFAAPVCRSLKASQIQTCVINTCVILTQPPCQWSHHICRVSQHQQQ